MKLHFLVEGKAEERLLDGLLPRLLPGHECHVHPHRGKGRLPPGPGHAIEKKADGLLDQLPAKLRAWGRSAPATAEERVVILVDADNDDCTDLLNRLRDLHRVASPDLICLFRIAIEETESWYLGDPAAIRRAFADAKLEHLRGYRPDSIIGAWERFHEVIGNDGPVDKPGWAEKMAPELALQTSGRKANNSPSFLKFVNGLLRLVAKDPDAPERTKRPRRKRDRPEGGTRRRARGRH